RLWSYALAPALPHTGQADGRTERPMASAARCRCPSLRPLWYSFPMAGATGPMSRATGGTTWAITMAVATGGAVGAVARYGMVLAWPQEGGGFPLTSLAVNLIGCLLIGVLMTWVRQARPHPLLRPFLGVGVLGGFTTFSTYAAESLAL